MFWLVNLYSLLKYRLQETNIHILQELYKFVNTTRVTTVPKDALTNFGVNTYCTKDFAWLPAIKHNNCWAVPPHNDYNFRFPQVILHKY